VVWKKVQSRKRQKPANKKNSYEQAGTTAQKRVVLLGVSEDFAWNEQWKPKQLAYGKFSVNFNILAGNKNGSY